MLRIITIYFRYSRVLREYENFFTLSPLYFPNTFVFIKPPVLSIATPFLRFSNSLTNSMRIQLACQLPKRLKSFRALAKLNALPLAAQFFEILAELIAFLRTARTTFCAVASPRKSINLRDRDVRSSCDQHRYIRAAKDARMRVTRWQEGRAKGIRSSSSFRARLVLPRRKYQRVSHISRIN